MAKFLDLTGLTSLVSCIKGYINKIVGNKLSTITTTQAEMQEAIGDLYFFGKNSRENTYIDLTFEETPTSGNPMLVFGRLGWSTTDMYCVGLIYFEENGTPISVRITGSYWSRLSIAQTGTYTYRITTADAWARLWFITTAKVS